MAMQHSINALFGSLSIQARTVGTSMEDLRVRAVSGSANVVPGQQKQLDICNKLKEDAEGLHARMTDMKQSKALAVPLADVALATETLIASMSRELAAIEQRLSQFGYQPPAVDENLQPVDEVSSAAVSTSEGAPAFVEEAVPHTPELLAKSSSYLATPASRRVVVASAHEDRTPTLEDFGISRNFVSGTVAGVAAQAAVLPEQHAPLVPAPAEDDMDEDSELDTLYLNAQERLRLCGNLSAVLQSASSIQPEEHDLSTPKMSSTLRAALGEHSASPSGPAGEDMTGMSLVPQIATVQKSEYDSLTNMLKAQISFEMMNEMIAQLNGFLMSRQFDDVTTNIDVFTMSDIKDEFSGAQTMAGKALIVCLMNLGHLTSCGKNADGDYSYRVSNRHV